MVNFKISLILLISVKGMPVRKISIITPCYNSEAYLKDTIESVICQAGVLHGRVELEYIICDGGSTDETLSIIKSFDNKHIKLITEKDSGMYHALSKGIRKATGDIVAYLNAGDYYSPYAFDVVCDVFDENEEVNWITGFIVRYNKYNQMISCKAPFRYKSDLIRAGIYVDPLPFIQQESTFWRSKLNNEIDHSVLSSLRLAGDYYLWSTFATTNELFTIDSYLGGFKIHPGQLSERRLDYLNEIRSFAQSPTVKTFFFKYMEKILWKMPDGVKRRLNRGSWIGYDLDNDRWSPLNSKNCA